MYQGLTESSGVHTREHLEDIVDDHYNELDIDLIEEDAKDSERPWMGEPR